MVTLSRRELLFWAGALLLLAIGIVRLAVPERSRMRPLSVEGIAIENEPIGQNQTLTRDKQWLPPDDVYVVGWSYHIGAPEADPELFLMAGNTTLFVGVKGSDSPLNPGFFQGGTGYLLRKGSSLTLRLRMTNSGPPGETRGAMALVYFVPVVGN